MAQRLVLHIGHYKTGTTAIQVFMARNRDQFLAQGLDYCDLRLHNAKHSCFAFALLKAAGATTLMHGFSDPTPPEVLWGQLFDHIRSSPAQTVLISSEEFMRLALFPSAVTRLREIFAHRPKDLQISVIVYLRPIRSHLRSWFNQLVKMHVSVPRLELALLNGAIEPIHYDYGLALSCWRTLVGDERLFIRSYIANRADSTALLRDFVTALGFTMPEAPNLLFYDPNPRLDDRILELARALYNAGFRKARVTALCDKALQWLEQQNKELRKLAETEQGFAKIRKRAETGLAELQNLVNTNFDLTGLVSDLCEETLRSDPIDPALVEFAFQALTQKGIKSAQGG